MDTVVLDRALSVLRDNRERFLQTPIQRKIQWLDRLMQNTLRVSKRMVAKALSAKQVQAGTAHEAEEWLAGPLIILRNLRLLHRSLEEIAKTGTPQIDPSRIRTTKNGQVVVDTFPDSIFDKLLYTGFRAETWMQPSVKRQDLFKTMGVFYQNPPKNGCVSLVLGAGNVASIGPLDAVYKLFVQGHVCLLKWNPVNDYLGPFVEEIFAPLLQEGFFRTAYGGSDVGAYLCNHDLVDEIHITGSETTHDIIVFGSGEEGKQRKAQNTPRLKKRITSELGNVSPVIVVPGEWNSAELRFHAENVATQMTNNAGFNCNAAKVLITHATWPQRNAFLDELRAVLRMLPSRNAYYPGAHDRYKTFLAAHPNAETFGSHTSDQIPWTLLPDLDARTKNDIAFQVESFCSITGEVPLWADDTAQFLTKAIDFCNDTLHGTLNACLLIHPRTQASLGFRFEDALARLRYGSIAINHWPALCYGLGVTPWGAFPGHSLDNIQSGIGVVHNTFLFDQPEKNVLYGPFIVKPRPPWFVTSRSSYKLAPILAEFEARPAWSLLPKILFYALQS